MISKLEKKTPKALESGVKNGRKGLGSIYVWAAGNGGEKNDHCGADGYNNRIVNILK